MKTLHLVNAWRPAGGTGGVTTFYQALLEHARQHGEQMVVVGPGERATHEVSGSTATYQVASPRAAFNPKYRMILPDTWPGVNRRVLQILRQEQPDLLDVCDKYSLHYVAGLLRRGWLADVKRPVLVATSCERMDENMAHYLSASSWARHFCRLYLKWNYFGFFDHHVTVSPHTAEELRQASRGHARTRQVWIRPMGVSSDRFSPRWNSPDARLQLRLRLDATAESKVVVYAGRLVPEKRLPLLLDTFAELLRRGDHDYRLAIAGDGILRQELAAECERRFQGAVTLLGHQEPADLAVILANSDVFLHPNPAEPFGIAPLEAMASGLPLVGCNSGGLLSFANSTNAWLAEPSAAALAQAVREALTDGEARHRRIAQAIATAQALNWSGVAADFRRLYRDLVHGRPTAAAFESTPGDWLGREKPVAGPL